MASRPLPPHIVALIHHVELSASGWRERLAEQLVLGGLSGRSDVTIEALAREISVTIDGVVPKSALDGAVRRLIGRGWVLQTGPNVVALSEKGKAEIHSRQQASERLTASVLATFEGLASLHCPALDVGELWTQFNVSCLEPMVEELGARTHAFLSGRLEDGATIHTMTGFVTRYDEKQQAGIRLLLDQFLTVDDPAVRSFVLQGLNAHFLRLAASLPEDVVGAVTDRLKKTVQLRLFLDTNFLFSLLDLHDNPANDAADDLVSALTRLHGKLDVRLYVYPLTLDEVKRTLTGYEHSLGATYLTPSLGRAALASRVRVSGVVLRYLRAVSESGGRLSVQDFLKPYLSNLVLVLRSKGVEVYNADLDGLTTRQDVIDDIVDVQKAEERRQGDRRKTYESVRHDVVLWHLVEDRRGGTIATPLDALFWVVTVDYRFIRFDGAKRRGKSDAVPVCVHPAVLLQMLQLLAPRDQEMEKAIFQGVRSLLPVVFDSAAERTTLRILSSMARFENVDDLPEETIADILVNDALRTSIAVAEDSADDVTLVKDAILGEVAAAKKAVVEEELARQAAERRMHESEERGARRVEDLAKQVMALTQERDLTKAQLGEVASAETAVRRELDDVMAQMTDLQDRERKREEREGRAKQWVVLCAVGFVAVLCGGLAAGAVAAKIAAVLPVSRFMSHAVAYAGVFCIAASVLLGTGSQLRRLHETRSYHVIAACLKWGLGFVVTLCVTFIGNALWERR